MGAIDSLLILLSGFPSFAVYALVGGVFGAVGTILASPFRKYKFAPVIPLGLAIGLTPTVTREYVLPAISLAALNKDMPMALDAVTTIMRVSASDTTLTYHYTLSDAVDPSADVLDIKATGLADLCAFWAKMNEASGFQTIEYSYALHGRKVAFTVSRSDCP